MFTLYFFFPVIYCWICLLVHNVDYERIIVNIICVIVSILPAVEDIQRKREIIWNHRQYLWFFDWDILN